MALSPKRYLNKTVPPIHGVFVTMIFVLILGVRLTRVGFCVPSKTPDVA